MTPSAETAMYAADSSSSDTTAATALNGAESTPLELEIVSDTICPWCFVGKRRIDRAIDELASEGIAVAIRWRPFELNPQMPTTGMNRKAYRSAKFGSWEHSQSLDAQVAAEGAREGIAFRHDLMERTPNTRASHQLIWLAHEVGGTTIQNAVVETLFSRYFCEGGDIGDRKVLTAIGIECGLPVERIAALFEDDDGAPEVLQEETEAISAGVRGVPLIVAGGVALFSGAQRTPLIVEALRKLGRSSATPLKSGEVDAHARA